MVESHHWVESHLFSTSKVIFSIKKNQKKQTVFFSIIFKIQFSEDSPYIEGSNFNQDNLILKTKFSS